MKELGVGIVYLPELSPLVEDVGLVNVLEVEPQGNVPVSPAPQNFQDFSY